MTDFGLWNWFIDEAGVRSWYVNGLPREIEQDLRYYIAQSDDFTPLNPRRFTDVRAAAVEMADRSVAHLNLPDHNPKHFQEVRDNGLAVFDLYFGEAATTTYLAVRQALEIALYCHDCYHCGSTLRIDAVRAGALHMPELGVDVSVEWVSALEMWRFGKQWELSVPMLFFMVCVILATTFAGATAQQRGLQNIPVVVPTHFISCLTRASDARLQEQFLEMIQKSINVNIGEIPASGQVTTYAAFVDNGIGFIANYLIECYQRLDIAAGGSLTERLGWMQTAQSHLAQLQQIATGQDPKMEYVVRSMLYQQHGIS